MCTCKDAVSTYVETTPYQSSYMPGTIVMEERYMNLLIVLNEATMRFPESSKDEGMKVRGVARGACDPGDAESEMVRQRSSNSNRLLLGAPAAT